jgi:probable HAF family extracellular repeat protein
VAALAAATSAQPQAPLYSLVDLRTAQGSNPMGLSDAGHVTGLYFGTGGQRRAFLWDNGAVSDLGTLGGIAQAFAVNDAGVVAGYSVDVQGRQRAIRVENRVITDLGTLHGGIHANANDINNAGWIVGMSQRRQGNEMLQRAALWRDGSVIDLGTFGGEYAEAHALNDAGQVVGWAWGPERRHRAFLWSLAAGMTDLGTLGGVSSIATDVNVHGAVVGSSSVSPGGPTRAFLWTPGRGMLDLGTPPGTDDSSANAINDHGQIVGSSFLPVECRSEPLLWHGGVLYLLNDRIDRTLGWTLIDARDINDRGEIAATARHENGSYGAVLLLPSESPGESAGPR